MKLTNIQNQYENPFIYFNKLALICPYNFVIQKIITDFVSYTVLQIPCREKRCICGNRKEILYYSTDGNIGFSSYPAIDYIRQASSIPDDTPDLKEKNNVIFKTAGISSDTIETVSGDRSVVLSQLRTVNKIKSFGTFRVYLYYHVEELKSNPNM